jgi:hypothetical protein
MDHPWIGRPVLDEMGFVAGEHLDSIQDTLYLHDFTHIGEKLLEVSRQPSGALCAAARTNLVVIIMSTIAVVC